MPNPGSLGANGLTSRGGSKDEYYHISRFLLCLWPLERLQGSLDCESLTARLREPNSPAQGTYNSLSQTIFFLLFNVRSVRLLVQNQLTVEY